MHFKKFGIVAIVVLCFATARAEASIQAQVGSLGFGGVTNSEDFESFSDGAQPGQPFSTASGFTFDLPAPRGGGFYIWPGDGGVGFITRSLYQNSGSSSMTSISLTSGADFEQIEFEIANGFGPADPQNVWVRAYNNGGATGDDFIFNLSAPGAISVWTDNGMAFDEIRVQSYANSAVEEDESQYGTASIDNVMVGSFRAAIPEPGTLAIWCIGLACIGFGGGRRRKK